MSAISTLGVETLSLRGANSEYNRFSRFFRTRAEAQAAINSSDWTPEAGVANACLTADEGVLYWDADSSVLVNADDATRTYINAQITNLVGDAPGVLDQLSELADALGDDANFVTTVNTKIDTDVSTERARAVLAEDTLTADLATEVTRATAAEAANAASIAGIQDGYDFTGKITAPATDNVIPFLFADQAAFPTAADVHGAVAHSHADGAIYFAHAGAWHKLANDVDVIANATDLATETNRAVTAEAALDSRLDILEADPTTKTYVDAQVSGLLDAAPGALDTLNELAAAMGDDANFATTVTNQIAVVQADVDANEAAALAGRNAIQADVDQNESDADAAIAAVQADVDQNEADADTAIAAVQADVDQNEADADAAIALKANIASPTFTGTPAAPTASTGTNTTQLATTAFVSAAVAGLVDGAPGAIDTLNELAAALGDDANFSTTITNSIAAVQADVDQNETDADAAEAALGVRIDNVETEIDTARTNLYTALGTAAESATAMGTFTGSTLSDNTTVRALLQELETDTESRLSKLGGTLTGNLTLRKSDGSAVGLVLSRQDHADMSCEWKVQPSYVSADKECLTVTANGQPVAHFDERQRFAINKTDPDYTLDVSGDGKFSTNLIVGGTLTLGSTAITATGAELNYVDGVTSNVQTQLDAIQADVDQNESDADAAAAANEVHIDNLVGLTGRNKNEVHLGTFSGSTISSNSSIRAALQELETKVEAVQTDVDGNESDADTAIALKADIAGPTFTGVPAAPTASAGTNTTQVATTAFVTTAVANVIDSAPGALDTLNELAAALGDDANFSTTITNAINANETHIDNAVTLTGVAKDAVNLGTFTGSTVSDSRTVKQALQELETAVEATPAAATASDTVKTQVAANSADYFLTFVDSNNTNATAEAVRTGANLKFNPSTKVLDISTGTVHAQYLTLDNTNVNSTAAELNILDGCTATAAELNILDGVTATTAELNYVDGVTSNIQTQLDAKLAAETITLTAFQAVVAASSDFADFQSRVAAL